MNIGTGKPSPDVLNRYPHYLVDVVDPDQSFSAGNFVSGALEAARDIQSRGHVPLFAGGTGLYVDAFFYGLDEIPRVSEEVHARAENLVDEKGTEGAFQELMQVDPTFANRIHPNDRQRITRGLEVYLQSGRPLSSFFTGKGLRPGWDVLFLALSPERKQLYQRIEDRIDHMLSQGWVDEVRELRKRGFGPELASMKALGYREIHAHLDGKLTLDEARDAIAKGTRHYAKRQLTWFRKNSSYNWYSPDQYGTILTDVTTWLESRN